MEETIHGTTMPVLELSLADGRVHRVRGRRVQLDVRRHPDGHQHRRRHGRQGDHGRRQARRLGRLVHDDDLHRPGRARLRSPSPRRCPATSCRSTWRRGTSSWCTATASWRPRPGSSCPWASSSPSAAASSAARASSCRRSAAPAAPSSTSRARSSSTTWPPGRRCGCTPATPDSSRPPCTFSVQKVPGPGQPLHGLRRPPLRGADRARAGSGCSRCRSRCWPASSASTCPIGRPPRGRGCGRRRRGGQGPRRHVPLSPCPGPLRREGPVRAGSTRSSPTPSRPSSARQRTMARGKRLTRPSSLRRSTGPKAHRGHVDPQVEHREPRLGDAGGDLDPRPGREAVLAEVLGHRRAR